MLPQRLCFRGKLQRVAILRYGFRGCLVKQGGSKERHVRQVAACCGDRCGQNRPDQHRTPVETPRLLIIAHMTEESWLRGQDFSSPAPNLVRSTSPAAIGLRESPCRDQIRPGRFLSFTPNGYSNTVASTMVRQCWSRKHRMQKQAGKTL